MARERLCSFSVHEEPAPRADRIDRAEALTFVRDGMHWTAVPFPPLWLASRRVWTGVAAYIAVAAAIAALAWLLMLPSPVTVLAFLALHLIFAGEADEMLRAHLAARGWSMVGQVSGTGRLDCERRFFDQWLPSVPMTADGRMPAGAGGGSSTTPAQANATPAVAASKPRSASILGNLLAPRRR